MGQGLGRVGERCDHRTESFESRVRDMLNEMLHFVCVILSVLDVCGAISSVFERCVWCYIKCVVCLVVYQVCRMC